MTTSTTTKLPQIYFISNKLAKYGFEGFPKAEVREIEILLVGGNISAEWQDSFEKQSAMSLKEHGKLIEYPYCEMHISQNITWDNKPLDSYSVTGYSGIVWPSAWPELFSKKVWTGHQWSPHRLTDIAKDMIVNIQPMRCKDCRNEIFLEKSVDKWHRPVTYDIEKIKDYNWIKERGSFDYECVGCQEKMNNQYQE